MAYCRFSEGDVYLYLHTDGYYECSSCLLADLVDSYRTRGWADLFTECPDCGGEGCEKCWCEHCQGAGCEHCQMHGHSDMATPEEAVVHLLAHRRAGHEVPQYAIDALNDEVVHKEA